VIQKSKYNSRSESENMLKVLKDILTNEWVNKHIAVVITIATFFLTVGGLLIKFLVFIFEKGKLDYWNIDSKLANTDNTNIFFEIAFYSIMFSAFLLIGYIVRSSYKVGFENYKSSKNYKQCNLFKKMIVSRFSPIFLVALFFGIGLNYTVLILLIGTIKGYIYLLIASVLLLILEIGMVSSIYDKTDIFISISTNKIWNKIGYSPIIICFVITSIYNLGHSTSRDQKKFDIIENGNYAVIAIHKDQFILSKSEIVDNTLFIYKGQKKIISINNIDFYNREFDKVTLSD
jgi:hypothetical protein